MNFSHRYSDLFHVDNVGGYASPLYPFSLQFYGVLIWVIDEGKTTEARLRDAIIAAQEAK